MDNYKDISISFSKLDIPQTDGYVCLGHFDCARIEKQTEGSQQLFYGFKDPEVISAAKTMDPEGLQRNYLIHSGSVFGDSQIGDNPHFRFAMTIALEKQEKLKDLKDYVTNFCTRLAWKKDVAYNSQFYWQFYYPVARGDIILLLDSNNFDKATLALYGFVYNNPLILYSYTIPMVSYNWLMQPEEHVSDDESKHCSMLLRATIKDYKAFYSFISSVAFCPRKTPKFSVSFGTEDVQVDFGSFRERDLHAYLNKVISEEGQTALREAVYSAELSVPRKVNTNRPRLEA